MRLFMLFLLLPMSWCGDVPQSEQDVLWLKAMEESNNVESKRAEDLKLSHALYEKKITDLSAAKEQKKLADAAATREKFIRDVVERYGIDISVVPASIDGRFFMVDEIPGRWRGTFFRAFYNDIDGSIKTAMASKFTLGATTGTFMAENASMLTVKVGQVVMAKIGDTEILILPEWPSTTKPNLGLFLVSGSRSIVAKMHGVWQDGRIDERVSEYFERVVDAK